MAIAGLHNVSALDSSFLRESPSLTPIRQGRAGTQASSLLQMWRDIEDDHVVSHAQESVRRRRNVQLNGEPPSTENMSESGGSESEDECGTWSRGPMGSQNEHEERNNTCLEEQSSDFGEVERERVRQIFKEWKNSGIRGHTSNVSQMNNSSRVQWLGENERERVRIVRQWVRMTSQQRGTCAGGREEQDAEIGAQIERVRDGLVVNHYEGQTEHVRRDIRRLCGRQALLDLLVKAERERQRELQGLLEHRPVSDFAHRNRIQSLLRGRFLRNGRLIQDEQPISVAASELGLLRQRHTVSGLREGFLSRLDNFVFGQSSTRSDTSSNNDINGYRNEQTQANCSQEVLDDIREQFEPSNEESDISGLSDHINDLEGNTVEYINQQDSTAQVEEWQAQVLENEERDRQRSASVEFIERRHRTGEDVVGNWQGSTGNEWSQETSGNEGGEHGHLQEAHEVFHERSQTSSEESDIRGLSDHTDVLEGNIVEDMNGQESTAQVEEWQEPVVDWQQLASVGFNEWRDDIVEDMAGNWQESTANAWPQDTSENEGGEPSHLREAHEVWHEDGSQEPMQNWFEGPSDWEAAPVGRFDTFYLPDDDNAYSLEVRELLSRGTVSNLLRSSFRESLDQLLQSYVERQSHAPVEWELHGSSPSPALVEQDQEQQIRDQNEGQSAAVERPAVVLPSPSLPPSQQLWDQELHHSNWPQRLGNEWEIINDLRIDMARLQHRMNNMQKMLEACMDMQLELQRSVRQEVSAALNRSAVSPDVCEDGLPKDGSKWDYVRKGICCICCDSNIDSLLYRCGHMCTCSKCANELFQGRGKCPMCWAPVVEVIRAYSTL